MGTGAVSDAGVDRRLVLEFVDAVGARRVEGLQACWGEPFERARPVRPFRFGRGQRGYAGWWWSSTTGELVGYESWLERDHVMLLDFDPKVVAFASQPFWLRWPGSGRSRRHAPDYFARRSDGSALVLDVRADDDIGVADAEAFDVTGRACAGVGWSFARLGELPPVFATNVRWLARYRHRRCAGGRDVAERLLDVFARPRPLFEGVEAVGERIMLLPVVYHLMWCQALAVDLGSAPFNASTLVGGPR